ncbi:MAG TPA: hypothetical protein VFV52_10150 [Bacilli bacterium]|nr:hypothetical protein [Bacilli bacterium]
MNTGKVLQILSAVVVLLLTLWAIQWDVRGSDYDFSAMIWIPSVGLLLYMGFHFLRKFVRTNYWVQFMIVGLLQMGLMWWRGSANPTDLFLGGVTLSMVSLLLYMNMFIALFEDDKSRSVLYFVAPIGLGLIALYYGTYQPFLFLGPITLLNVLVLWRLFIEK